jgi:hypothetical protein
MYERFISSSMFTGRRVSLIGVQKVQGVQEVQRVRGSKFRVPGSGSAVPVNLELLEPLAPPEPLEPLA